jgi:DNA-binding CsgD family transcriptional regulator
MKTRSNNLIDLCSATTYKELWKATVVLTEKVFPVSGVVGLVEPLKNSPHPTGLFFHSTNLRGRKKHLDLAFFRDDCPFTGWFAAHPRAMAVGLDEIRLMAGSEVRSYETKNLTPYGWKHAFALAVRQERDLVGLISFFRGEEENEFCEWERCFLENVIQPNLMGAFAQIRIYQQELARLHAMERSVAELDLSVMILDWDLRVICQSRAAEFHCARLTLGEQEKSHDFPWLPEKLVKTCLQLKYDHESSTKEDWLGLFPGELAVSAGDGLSAMVRRFFPKQNHCGKPLFQIIFFKPETVSEVPLCWEDERLQSFRLSSAEKSVVELVCQGLSNLEIAVCLNKKTDTVKKQLQSVFRKMNIQSRAKLINLLTHGRSARGPIQTRGHELF